MFYAVNRGFKPGIYDNWEECKKNVNGFKKPIFKKFKSLSDAEDFLKNGFNSCNKTNSYLNSQSEDYTDYDIKVYTDGSCYGNGQDIAFGGIGIYINDSVKISKALVCKKITNNVAELIAILKAFSLLKSKIVNGKKILVVTDSEYSIRAFTSYGQKCNDKFWKGEIPNKELIKKGFMFVKKYPNIKFKHIFSHTGKKDEDSINNDIVDKLAFDGMLKSINLAKKIDLEKIKFKFGKFKGNTLKEVNTTNSQYMKWMYQNLKNDDVFKIILKKYLDE